MAEDNNNQDHKHKDGTEHSDHSDPNDHADEACGFHEESHGTIYQTKETAFHHIADANVYSIGPLQIPLPVIAYAPSKGFDFF